MSRASRSGPTGSRPELADVLWAHGERLSNLNAEQARVVAALTSCRTAARGGHVRECDCGCGYTEISYNSCRDRHCPKCQGLERVRWQEARAQDLLPVPYFHLVFTVPDSLHDVFLAHSRVCYGLLFTALERAVAAGQIAASVGGTAVARSLRQAARRKWVVYSKRPFAGPEQVLAYLGRYTHRIAISNERIIALDDDTVTFSYKDRVHNNRRAVLTLPAEAFLRRFLLHVLPRGFVRIRHYGLLANSVRRARIAGSRELLGVREESPASTPHESWQEILLRLTGKDVTRCPHCGEGRLHTTRCLTPGLMRRVPARAASP